MRNKIGIYHLFGENEKAKKEFFKWVKNSGEFCQYDMEHIEIDLYLPSVNNTKRYFNFSAGNILDWLETKGYYIGIPLRGEFKYVTVVHFNSNGNVSQKPIYSNSGVKSRNRAIELGVVRAVNDLETKIEQQEEFIIPAQRGESLFPTEQIKNRLKELPFFPESELKPLREKWKIEIQNLLNNGTPTEYLNDELLKEIYNYRNEKI